MKVTFLNNKTPNFKGVREDRNTTAQLKQNNNYSLTEPNQRRINKAIENLAKQQGEENIRFLLDIGENLKYQTNIDNGKTTKNEWKSKLKNATEQSLAHSNPILKEKYQPEIDRVFNDKKELSTDEKALLAHKRSILKRADLSQLKSNPNENIRNLEKNMDYFITSTETPIKQKRYVMSKLDYMMSPNYKINPQLENKKTQVLAEIMNDMVIDTPESKIPNMKAVNQKTHGMCAAISIARKSVAYEDKPNYVDAILSELNNKPYVEIYDRQNLGSGKRIPVKKIPIDFKYAQEKGYRIIDASTLQWMNIAGMYGAQNENLHDFNAFDKNNFDAFHDSFFVMNHKDEAIKKKQCHYQALAKAKDTIGGLKSSKIKSKVENKEKKLNYNNNLDLIAKTSDAIRNDIKSIVPKADKKDINNIFTDLNSLYNPTSEKIAKTSLDIRKYTFLPNEESSQKTKKIKLYFNDKYSDKINVAELDKRAKNVIDKVITVNSLEKSLHNSTSLSGKIRDARNLYEAEAIYRASVMFGLMEPDNLTDNLIKENIPDRETRILKGYDEVINKIEKNNDKKLMKHFAPYFETTEDDKEGIIEGLKVVRQNVEYITTEGFDSLYASLGYGSRSNLLAQDIQSSKEEIEHGDKDELKRAAICLHTKQDKKVVVKELNKLIGSIEKNPFDQDTYVNAFNKIGYKDQTGAFIDVFKNYAGVLHSSEHPDFDMYITQFKLANGMPMEASNEEVEVVFNRIVDGFNIYSQAIENAAHMLEVENEDGSPYHTIVGANILMKRMENNGKLIPEKDMRMLQDRFTKIDKIRSSDEFSSRQGKISDPSLYKLSNGEKNTLKKIDKKLNAMYSDVVRDLNYEFKEIKEPLSKLASYVGTNEGFYWVGNEGHSGLYGSQQVKILEQLTDRPYRMVNDINKAVEEIKSGPYSGVSSSSVFHDRMGGHAMYIADISTFGKDNKEAIMHDNTWGASEHENTWVDSEGILRTDYSDRRGGDIGYITDKNWRNGNFVENLTHKKGHISGESVENKTWKKLNPGANSEYDFQLMSDIILPGQNSEHKDIAGGIKDTIFIPDTMYLKDLANYAQGMTKQEIKKAIFKNETAGIAYAEKYDKIMKRIDKNTFNKGINTPEQYNALSDNDIIKIAFEKAAVRESYPDAIMYDELGSAKTLKDIQKVKEKQREIARENFNYAFSKNETSLLHVAFEHGRDIANVLNTILKDNNFKLDDKNLPKVTRNVAIPETKEEKAQITGSLKDSINFMVEKTLRQYDEHVPETENKAKARAEIEDALRHSLEEALYFNKEDLKQNSDKAKGIREWIDYKFNPKSDEEFIEIYRSLQDMPLKDFEKLTTNLSDKHLGMENITGFDMLMKVKAANDDAESTLRNTLFFDEYCKDIQRSKTKPNYKYNKLERKTRGATYIGNRTFDDIYRTMYFSLSSLTYESMFNKYKDINFKKYGALAAYPKIDLSNDPVLLDKINTSKELTEQTFGAINSIRNVVYDIKLVHKMDEYRTKIESGRKLTPTERYNIQTMAGDFITQNQGDPDIERSLNAAMGIMEFDSNVTIDDINPFIDEMTTEFYAIENMNDIQGLKNNMVSHIDGLKHYFNTLITTSVPPRYQRILKDDVKNWLQLEMRGIKSQNGLDKYKSVLELEDKIKDASINNTKAQDDHFARLVRKVDQVKLMKLGNKQKPEELEKAVERINVLTDKFVEKYIRPEMRKQIKANMLDWTSKELVGGNKLQYNGTQVLEAQDKFAHDLRKYHVNQHPIETFNNWLLLNAKDSEKEGNTEGINKENEQIKRLRDTYGRYAQIALNNAQLIEIQDLLMEAVQTGNAAQVKDYFSDYYVYTNGASTMDDDLAIDHMVRSLILQDNTETAKMFVEKLGLADKVLDIEHKLLTELKPKNKIKEIAKIMKDTNMVASVAKAEVEKLALSINDSEDIVASIENTKQQIQLKTKKAKNKDLVNCTLEALDNTRELLVSNPDISRTAMLAQEFQSALNDMGHIANKSMDEKQEILRVIRLVYQFLTELQVPEYDKAYKKQQEIAKEFEELTQFNIQTMQKAAQSSTAMEVYQK